MIIIHNENISNVVRDDFPEFELRAKMTNASRDQKEYHLSADYRLISNNLDRGSRDIIVATSPPLLEPRTHSNVDHNT